MQTTESLIIGYSVDSDKDVPVLVVGQKQKNESVKIINAFQGENAKTLFDILTGKKKKEEAKTDD